MKKLIVILILYALIITGIIIYYKLKNKKMPFTAWGFGYKTDITFNERLCLALLISFPYFTYLFIL